MNIWESEWCLVQVHSSYDYGYMDGTISLIKY